MDWPEEVRWARKFLDNFSGELADIDEIRDHVLQAHSDPAQYRETGTLIEDPAIPELKLNNFSGQLYITESENWYVFFILEDSEPKIVDAVHRPER